jgi:uncharacterized membrane protein YhaH (DUF805 family)
MKLSASRMRYLLMLLTSVIVAVYYIEINQTELHPATTKDYLINLGMFSVIAYFIFAVFVLLPTSLIVMKLHKMIDTHEAVSTIQDIDSVFIITCVATIWLCFLTWLWH